MSSFNKVILMGNLVRDPELRIAASDLPVCKFTMAVNRRFARKDGEIAEEVCYIDVTAFGRRAEVLADHMQKGSPIHIEGRLQLEQWEDSNTGQKRSKIGVILESFSFVGSKNKDEDDGVSLKDYSAKKQSAPVKNTTSQSEYDEEDVPF